MDTTGPAQLGDLRRHNVAALLNVIREHGPIARAEIAHRTGLAAGSVTRLSGSLIAAGLLREHDSPRADGQIGRPRVPLELDGRHYYAIGAHFGFLRTSLCLVDLAGRVIEELVIRHRGTAPRTIIRRAAERITALMAQAPEAGLLGVGATAGGWVDPDAGVIVEHAALNWRDVPLRDHLRDAVGQPVFLDSTVRAIALAEARFGIARDTRTLLHVFAGNIVGAAVLVDGHPLYGPGSAAGYLDHLPTRVRTSRQCSCGRYDCLQAVASDVAVVEEARRRGLLAADEQLDELVAAARAGSARARNLLRTRAHRVGAAIALLVEVLNPDRVVVGGGVLADPAYLADLRAAVAANLHRAPPEPVTEWVHATSFGRRAPMIASATVFLDAYYRDPLAFPPLRHDLPRERSDQAASSRSKNSR